jgi:uncharacterized membrane protein
MEEDDSRSRRWVHRTLLIGLVASALLLIGGCVIVFSKHQTDASSTHPRLVSLVKAAASGDGLAILNLGLLILMLTPVARVLILALGWLFDGNRLFAGVAATVLVLLAISVCMGVG